MTDNRAMETRQYLSPLVARVDNHSTGKFYFRLVKVPRFYADACIAFYKALDSDADLLAEVDDLFAEYRDKVPNFWETSQYSTFEPVMRSQFPVVWEYVDYNYMDTPPQKMAVQVLGSDVHENSEFAGWSLNVAYRDFFEKLAKILDRFHIE